MKRNKKQQHANTTATSGKWKCVLVEQMQKVRLSALHFKRTLICVI